MQRPVARPTNVPRIDLANIFMLCTFAGSTVFELPFAAKQPLLNLFKRKYYFFLFGTWHMM